MHIQRNSAQIRKYIEPTQYFQLEQEQLSKTYIYKIGRGNCSPKSILERIWELEILEKQGFVYWGKKNWLQDCLKERGVEDLNDEKTQQYCLAINYEYPQYNYPTYDKWIINYLSKYLNINFVKTEHNHSIDYDMSNRDVISYMGTLNLTSELFLNFSQLSNQSFEFGCEKLDLYLLGNEKGVFSNSACKLFEVLHNLEYYIAMLPEHSEEPFEIKSLVFDNLISSEEFMMNTLSVYGADMDYFFVGNKFRIY